MNILERLRERGPITVAAFMEIALYDPEYGYYARAAQRSGRAGDFFTSVDVGPLFGELLEMQIAEMADLLEQSSAPESRNHESPSESRIPNPESRRAFDLVEAGAGNGRLSADILAVMHDRHPGLFDLVRLHLVEASAAARANHVSMLGDASSRLTSSGAALPDGFEGVLLANELIDAMPVHEVIQREHELHEIYVEATADHLRLVEGPLSTPRLDDYMTRLGVTLQPGWRAEVNLAALDWVRDAARRLRRGFIILIDYGHEARELYSVTHSSGTLTTFAKHRGAGPETGMPVWLAHPGEQDITAHVDFTSIRAAAESEGLQTIAFLDQTYFLLGLLQSTPNAIRNPQSAIRNLQTLIAPGGLGSTMKVLILGKRVGVPALRGCSFSVRAT